MPVVIISGVNTGIGLGLFQRYAARDGHIVVGTYIGSPPDTDFPVGKASEAITVSMDVTDVDGPQRAIEQLKARGIDHFDVVRPLALDVAEGKADVQAISNAGIMSEQAMSPIRNIDPRVFEDHWRVNVKGNLLFFQACVPILRPGAKFIFISSGAAILERVPDKQNVCYGITKIGATYLARYAHFEHPDLVIFPICPGWVATQLGKITARYCGLAAAPTTIDESVSGLMQVFDVSTRETHGGRPWSFDGTQPNW